MYEILWNEVIILAVGCSKLFLNFEAKVACIIFKPEMWKSSINYLKIHPFHATFLNNLKKAASGARFSSAEMGIRLTNGLLEIHLSMLQWNDRGDKF